ncbi:hypothetical protein ABY45_16495 [Microbacterium maritypicum]|uniref:hypothetical protein n=1 Tax=Microbacterium maritypicum TaxID=33918 RepID=UPI003D6FAB59
MEYLLVGGPLDGHTQPHPRMPGYEVDTGADTPTLRWQDGPVFTLRGGPFDGEQLPAIPGGYEADLAQADVAVWTMRGLSYNIPYPADQVYPTVSEMYCSSCGKLSRFRSMSALTLVIHPVTGTHGHFRFYCPSHVPNVEWNATREDRRQPCPSCSMLMPMSGVCDFCD